MNQRDDQQPASDENPQVASLRGPRMPADRGLASLGLLMQLSGSLYLGYMLLVGVSLLFMDSTGEGMTRVLIFFAASAVRSGFHRAAGTTLIYGSPAGSFAEPTGGIRMYIMIALAHTILCGWLLHPILHDTALLVSILALLAAWPLTLAVVVRLPSVAAMAEMRPRSEDLGLEGASALMLIFGIVGAMVSALALYSLVTGPSSTLFADAFTRYALLAICAVLLARSTMHAVAGLRGLSRDDREAAAHNVRRYVYIGKISAGIAGVLGGILMLRAGTIFFGFIWAGALVYFLLIWPLILDQFMDRYEIDAGMGVGAYRAPDAGLTALGWLLLALGVLNAVSAVSQVIFEMPNIGASLMGTMDAWEMAESAGRSPWFFVGVSGLQLWAAIELCAMSDRSRLAASLYGAITTLVTLYLFWPALRDLDELSAAGGGFMQGGYVRLAQLGIALVIPVVTLVMANLEGFAVQARARYREPAA